MNISNYFAEFQNPFVCFIADRSLFVFIEFQPNLYGNTITSLFLISSYQANRLELYF